MRTLIYLASPYSHPDEVERQLRFRLVCRKAAKLIQEGRLVFSPIAHSHPIAVIGDLDGGFSLDFELWREFDQRMLAACDMVWVYCIDGWKESKGIAAEIEIAKRLGKEIHYIK